MSVKYISYLELWQPLWWSGTICAILVEGIMRNNSVKLFCLNLDQWFICRLKDFLSRALDVLMFSGAEPFVQFW